MAGPALVSGRNTLRGGGESPGSGRDRLVDDGLVVRQRNEGCFELCRGPVHTLGQERSMKPPKGLRVTVFGLIPGADGAGGIWCKRFEFPADPEKTNWVSEVISDQFVFRC